MSKARFHRFFLIVEGPDDSALATTVIRPLILGSCPVDYVDVVSWATYSKRERRELIRSIVAMGATYLVIADLDEGCVTLRKQKLTRSMPYLDALRLVIVRREIEAWYLAGAPLSVTRRLVSHRTDSTDDIRKEQFEQLLDESGLDLELTKAEILLAFVVLSARQRNTSFEYLMQKISC